MVLGSGFALLNLYGVLKPAAFGVAARKFPRHGTLGYPLILLATAWFLYYVREENVADFTNLKPVLYGMFTLVGLGSCLFLHDFLPVRGLAALMLLGAKLTVDTARWVNSDWRLVLVVWAYIWVLAGMWLTISPWRLRDLIQWGTASEGRIRWLSAVRLGFGLFVAILGLTVLRTAEKSELGGLQPGPQQGSGVSRLG
jgi:hypothetical protein